MLAQRAVADSPRWTRAVEDQSAPIPEEITSKLGETIYIARRARRVNWPIVIGGPGNGDGSGGWGGLGAGGGSGNGGPGNGDGSGGNGGSGVGVGLGNDGQGESMVSSPCVLASAGE